MRVPPCVDEGGGCKRAEGCASSFQCMAPSFQRRLESSVRDSGAHTGRRGAPRRSSAWPPSFQRRLESSVRDSGAHTERRGAPRRSSAWPRHSSEGWNPACATAERTRGGGVRLVVPVHGPVIPAKAGIQRARQRSAHGAEGCASSFQRMAPSFQRRLESRQGMRVPLARVRALRAQRAEPYIVIGALIPISPSVRDSAVCAASASFSRAFISGASAGSAESTRQWS